MIDDTLKGYEVDIAKLQNKLREARAAPERDRGVASKAPSPAAARASC